MSLLNTLNMSAATSVLTPTPTKEDLREKVG
jgi:hypothetical protein